MQSYLQSLDSVQNAAIRTGFGAYRTSPISSLHVEANELPTGMRREKLDLQYVVKLASNPNNPSYDCVIRSGFKVLFDAKPHIIPTLGIRIH